MSEIRRAFGLAVRIFRERQGWSQAQLAQSAGIDRGYISRIESGSVDPGLEIQRRLANALSISHSALIPPAGGARGTPRSLISRRSAAARWPLPGEGPPWSARRVSREPRPGAVGAGDSVQ